MGDSKTVKQYLTANHFNLDKSGLGLKSYKSITGNDIELITGDVNFILKSVDGVIILYDPKRKSSFKNTIKQIQTVYKGSKCEANIATVAISNEKLPDEHTAKLFGMYRTRLFCSATSGIDEIINFATERKE